MNRNNAPRRRLAGLPLVLPAVAALLVALRWWSQGSGNLYSQGSARLYVTDPDLGWRLIDGGPLWLGLDALALIALTAAVTGVGILWIRRRERNRRVKSTRLVAAVWTLAVAPILLPLWAFSTGGRPDGARDLLPVSVPVAAHRGTRAGIDGLGSATYRVLDHEGTSITARVSAGGESFDARFDSEIRGELSADLGDLNRPMSAAFTVSTAVIDTGIDLRTASARDYFQVDSFPEARLDLSAVTGTEQISPDEVAFTGTGTFSFMAGSHEVTVTGRLKRLAPDARARLEIDAGEAVLLSASFNVDLTATPINDDIGDFDETSVPVVAQLLLGLAVSDVPITASLILTE